MNKLTPEIYHSEKFDINIHCYLTYAQIQQIAKAVSNNPTDNWAERQENIDMLMLYHATDIGKDKLEELGHDAMVESGLIDEVECNIWNYYDIQKAIDYIESPNRVAYKFVSQLPKLLDNEMFKTVLAKYGASKE